MGLKWKGVLLPHQIGSSVTYQMYICNLTVGIKDEHTESLSWIPHTKVFLLLHFLSCCWEERNSMKTESTAFAEQKETTFHEEREREGERAREREREQKQSLNFLFGFSCCSNIIARWFRLHSWHLVWDPFWELTQKWWLQPSAIFTLPYLVFNWLVFISSNLQPNSL